MYALVDCNNFYCSVERVFNPRLNGRPIVVLSNNDGCAISRSDEAKALGVTMGTPFFMLKDQIEKHNVAVFSSNYTLYGDMSDRVMTILAEFCSRMEVYSIDEAYLDLHGMPYHDLLAHGMQMRNTVLQLTGIPVTVGIAATKTLAKMANHYAKKKFKDIGVFWAANNHLVNEMLEFTEVGDICGIGHKYALFLKTKGFKTAADFARAPEEFVRVKMTVVGQRLLSELRGTPAIKWEFETPVKKNITNSRSFGHLLRSKQDIAEALSNYAANVAEKLRAQKSHARRMTIFIQTNPHRIERPQYLRSIELKLENATSDTSEIIKYALKGLDHIFKEGYEYMKAGVILSDFVPESVSQQNMFTTLNPIKRTMMRAMDKINRSLGKEAVRMATQGFTREYRLQANYLSPKYTTRIEDILKVY